MATKTKSKPAPEPVALDENAQNADKLKRIRHQNAECRRLQLAWGAAKDDAKLAKDLYTDATDVLHNLIAETPQGELFAKATKEMDGEDD